MMTDDALEAGINKQNRRNLISFLVINLVATVSEIIHTF